MTSTETKHASQELQATLAFQVDAQLGEASIWNHRTGELYWVDIEKGLIHIFNPETQIENVIAVGQRIGTIVPAENGNLIIALQEGIFEFNLLTLERTLIVKPPHDTSTMRYNDGKCDARGRFWVGSMHLSVVPKAAALYRIDNGESVKMLGGVTISNGICWTDDQKTMYYIDTPTSKIRAFDFDASGGTISNERVIIEMKNELAKPDGMTIDENGNLWIAHWGGSCVTQWDPSSGKMLSKIQVPAFNITSCAFGGKNLDTLYITTSSTEMTADRRVQFPLAGSLFKASPGVKGVKCNFYKG